jgi:hypothetical protein
MESAFLDWARITVCFATNCRDGQLDIISTNMDANYALAFSRFGLDSINTSYSRNALDSSDAT